ncbi:MAG: amidohydrolase family protein [Chloroflexia bacterium]|nr:amidohydrolase family protein [Chloroflexia bacterium]
MRFVRLDDWFALLYRNPNATLASAEDLIASMDAAGIQRSVLCGFPWRDPGLCAEHNAYMAAVTAESGGRLAWLAAVSPVATGAANMASVAFAAGAAGIGELNADAQGFDLRSARDLAETVEACVAHDRPVMFHVSEPVGHAYPGKGTSTPDRLLAFLLAFPEARVVAAHWGGGLPFYELMPEVAVAARRVTYDSAASTYLYRFEVFRRVIDLAGPDRVMFATDFPVLRQDRFLRRALAVPMDDAERGAVLSGTAARVYGLDAGPAPAPVDSGGRS